MIHIEAIEPRRHFSAVSLDASFGTAGVVPLRDGIAAKSGRNATTPTSMVVDHAGRVIVVTTSEDTSSTDGSYPFPTSVMTRLLPDGRPDPRFAVATGGSVDLDVSGPQVVVDSQNRIYVLGGDVTRYTASGKIDRTYADHGTTNFIRLAGDEDVLATDITIGPGDGVWAFLQFSTEMSSSAAIVRLTADGKELGYVSGVPYAPVTPGDVYYHATGTGPLRTLADGSVMAIGHVHLGIYPTRKNSGDGGSEDGVTVLKFTPGGKPDRTYGTRGQVFYREVPGYGYGYGANITSVGIADDGTVLLRNETGSGKIRNLLITPTGRSGGLKTVGPRILDGQILVQPDGRRLVLDTVAKTLRRYKADGAIDSAFNDGLPVSGVDTMAFGPAGTLLIADTGRDATDTRYAVRRIDL